jgi:ATP-dependent Clp protease protease subunit
MDDETWFNGQNAVDEGMADSILASTEIEDKPSQGTKSLAAVRRVDSALARLNLSRNERRSLIGELKGGMQDAAPSATHDAGGLSEPLLDLLRTIKGS